MMEGRVHMLGSGFRLARVIVPVAALILLALPAVAMPASCQEEFDKHGAAREAEIQKINAFNKKKPTATAACGAFNKLVSVEAAMLKWMTANQDWCQLPEPIVASLKEASEQSGKVRANICTAAKKEAQMREQGGAGQRAPAPGGGVRLPSGAL